MPICTACQGGGVQHLTVREDGKPERVTDIPCVWCHGSGEVTQEVLEELKTYKTMWCQCGNPSGDFNFYDDGQHSGCPYRIHKHHYHCADCLKITQIG